LKEAPPQTPPQELLTIWFGFANHVAPRGAACGGKKCNAPINALNFKFSAKPVKSFGRAFLKARKFQRLAFEISFQGRALNRSPQRAKFSFRRSLFVSLR